MIKRRKYGNSKVTYNGIDFDSKKEMMRYIELADMQAKGLISHLKLQVSFELLPKITEIVNVELKTKTKSTEKVVQRPTTYVCDFTYIKDGEYIVEDVKISPKMLPPEYVLKKKMMFYFHKIKIKEYYGNEKRRSKSTNRKLNN